MPTRKWGSEKLVNTGLAGNQLNSEVAGLDGGGYVVVWEDDSDDFAAIRAQRFDATGNKLGTEMTIIQAAGNNEILPTVTALDDGGFYVNWTQQNGFDNYILGNVYDANGAFVRDQTAIFAFGLDDFADNCRLGTGSVVVWRDPDANDFDVDFRIFDADGIGGSTLTANTTLTGHQRNPSVSAAPSGNQFAIAWDDGPGLQPTSIKARVFDSSGAELVPEFTVVAKAGNEIGVFAPTIAWLNEDQFAVTWENGTPSSDVFVRLFDIHTAQAVPLTGSILVNSTTKSQQTDPQIVALPNGGFVVAWGDFSGVGGDDGFSVRLQAFDGSGGKVGGEFLVNTTTTDGQFDPSISALADGRIVVSWTDVSSGNEDIRTQIVDPRDGVVNGTPHDDTLYGNDVAGDEINGYDGRDNLYGLKGNDQLFGGDDNDILFAGFGDDVLFGGAGNDILRGDAGADDLNGEAGIDTATYVTAALAVRAALDGSLAGTNDAAGDTYTGVENLIGSNAAGGDTLRGNSGANTLQGLAGNDILQGLAGNDVLMGGLGADTMSGSTGNDRFHYNAINQGGDTITDFANVAGNNDSFNFFRSAFLGSGAQLPAGTLAAANFAARAADHNAQDANDYFLYQTNTHQLWYDPTGSATAGDAVLIATVQAAAVLTNADIVMI